MSLTIEEICPECGGRMNTYIEHTSQFECVIRTVCMLCDYEKPDLNSTTYTNYDSGTAVGSVDPNCVTIEADNIILSQKDLGMTIDVPFSVLCKIETIQINGIKFVKEN